MRKFFVILSLLLFNSAFCADMLDVDYQFIDNAFNGSKAVSDKEFNDAINKMTPAPPPETFGEKLKVFFLGRKNNYEPKTTAQQMLENNKKDAQQSDFDEAQIIKDMKNGIYYIKLVVSVVGTNGEIITAGNYKIQEKEVSGKNMLVFYQGHKEYGMLELKKFEDNLKGKYDITYSRIDILSDDIVRIVYSTLDDTKCAIAKVYLQN